MMEGPQRADHTIIDRHIGRSYYRIERLPDYRNLYLCWKEDKKTGRGGSTKTNFFPKVGKHSGLCSRGLTLVL